MGRTLSLDWLTVYELGPIELVTLAARVGCSAVQLRLVNVDWCPAAPRFDLIADGVLRRAVVARAASLDIAIGFIDPLKIDAKTVPSDFGATLDAAAALGARGVNAVSLDTDESRFLDRFAALVQLAAERGLTVLLEPFASSPVNSFGRAADIVSGVGDAAAVNLDTLHLFRTGGSVELVTDLDPGLIGYAQISDGRLKFPLPDPDEEMLHDRLVPGEGEFPLRELIASLPADLPIGIEIPMRSRREPPSARAHRAARAVRALIAES